MDLIRTPGLLTTALTNPLNSGASEAWEALRSTATRDESLAEGLFAWQRSIGSDGATQDHQRPVGRLAQDRDFTSSTITFTWHSARVVVIRVLIHDSAGNSHER